MYATFKAYDYMEAEHMGVPQEGKRRGMYTDDSQSMLALATSLMESKGVDPQDIATKHWQFYEHTPLRYERSVLSP